MGVWNYIISTYSWKITFGSLYNIVNAEITNSCTDEIVAT